jgi:transcriptional regulator
MYVPKEFKVRKPEEILEFIRENTFATLISNGEVHPIASHLPLVVKTNAYADVSLEGHISLANPQQFLLNDNRAVLCIFHGPHGYVSSSVYSHHNVPTWNYQSVHAYCKVEKLSDAELDIHLAELVDQYEKERVQPLKYTDFSQDMLVSYKKEIIGFRLRVEKIEASFKLSQNRNEQDHQAIIDDLGKCPINHALVDVMKKNR